MPRRCKHGFLKKYLTYIRETEVPLHFGLWCGISGIANSLGRKCFLNTRPIIFPNLYIILVAQSALCRKSTALDQMTKLLKQTNQPPRFGAQKTSLQKLISSLCATSFIVTDKKTGRTTEAPKLHGYIVARELGSLLTRDSMKTGMLEFLTDIYDCEDYTYETHTRGNETIKDPCIDLLGATTMSWMRDMLPEEAIGGGFTSRVVFVYSNMSSVDNPWGEYTSEILKMEHDLIYDLNCIKEIEGIFKPTPEGKEFFSQEYIRFKRNSPIVKNEQLAGYGGRRGTILQKVAMAFSASDGDDLIISEKHYAQAKELLESTEASLPKIMQDVTLSAEGHLIGFVREIIRANKQISRTDLMRRCSHKMKSGTLDEIVRTLEDSKSIVQHIDTATSKVFYIYLTKQAQT